MEMASKSAELSMTRPGMTVRSAEPAAMART
jgi:hypothetical protein